MSEAVDVIAQTLRCAGVLVPNDFADYRTYEQKIHSLAVEIDAALGGLSRHWSVRYEGDDRIVKRPSPGLPNPEMAERLRQLFQHGEKREIVVGWVGGWTAEVTA